MKKYCNQPKTVETGVLEILKDCPNSRYDDMTLMLHYYLRYGNVPVALLPFTDMMVRYKEFGLPCFESIRRARQRVQSCYPELSREPQPRNGSISVTITIEQGV